MSLTLSPRNHRVLRAPNRHHKPTDGKQWCSSYDESSHCELRWFSILIDWITWNIHFIKHTAVHHANPHLSIEVIWSWTTIFGFEKSLQYTFEYAPPIAPFKFITMRVIDTIDDLATEAAAGDDIKKYLQLRGIRTVASLALVAPDEETLNRHIIDPLLGGWTQEGVTINVNRNEQPIARAILLHMWNLAKASWSRHLAAQMTPPSATPSATPSTTATSPTPNTEQKAPKTLPPGVWSGLLRAYNTIQLAGEDREFPVLQVLGAEVTIARMHHEHTVTSLYSQVQLGELVQRRSFTAGGDINPLAKNKKGTTLELGDDNTLIATDDISWSPRSLLAIMDGLDSIRWAMILVKWGDEKSIHELFDWLNQRARSRPNKTEQFAHYWQSVSWTIAMMLRSGQTFKEITTTITKDLDKFNDYMAPRKPYIT